MNSTSSIPRPSDAAIAALQTGNKIEAIKITRTQTGLGLKEAKDLIDAYIAQNPALHELLESKSNAGMFIWIFTLSLIAIAVALYFRSKL